MGVLEISEDISCIGCIIGEDEDLVGLMEEVKSGISLIGLGRALVGLEGYHWINVYEKEKETHGIQHF